MRGQSPRIQIDALLRLCNSWPWLTTSRDDRFKVDVSGSQPLTADWCGLFWLYPLPLRVISPAKLQPHCLLCVESSPCKQMKPARATIHGLFKQMSFWNPLKSFKRFRFSCRGWSAVNQILRAFVSAFAFSTCNPVASADHVLKAVLVGSLTCFCLWFDSTLWASALWAWFQYKPSCERRQ